MLAVPGWCEEHDAAWFKANYLPAAQRLERYYGECSANVLFTVTADKPTTLTRTTFHYEFAKGRGKFDRTTEATQPDGSTTTMSRSIVASPEVCFSVLTRDGAGAVLAGVERGAEACRETIRYIEIPAGDSIYEPFMILNQRVAHLIEDSAFQFKGVESNGDRVRVTFQYTKPDQQHDGWVEFLPERQWVIDSCDVNLRVGIGRPDEYHYRYASKISYGGDDPVPAIRGSIGHAYHADRTDLEEMTVSELTFGPRPASGFMLSSYGYDDRIDSAAEPSRLPWLWLATAGVLCVVGTLAIKRIRARR